jgi:hypothetical protein
MGENPTSHGRGHPHRGTPGWCRGLRPAGPFGKGKLRVGSSPGRQRQASGHGHSKPHATRGRGRRVAASVGSQPGQALGAAPGRVGLLPFMRDAHKRASSQIHWRWRAKQIQRTGLAQLHFQEHQLPTSTEDKHRSWLAADGASKGAACASRRAIDYEMCVLACLWSCL